MTRAVGMHAETFDILRHIEVHGPRTRDEIVKGLKQATADVGKRLANLAAMGYVARDETTHPISFSLSNKARTKLGSPNMAPLKSAADSAPAMRKKRSAVDWSEAKAQVLRRIQAADHRRVQQSMATPYRATEYQPSGRRGAMDFTLLPSRVGDQLRYRDGRVTDMADNPITPT